MKELFDKLERKIIVSAQASKGDSIYEGNCLTAIIKAVINGGAAGLRLAGTKSIRETKKFSGLPVIGITKPDPLPDNRKEIVYITPSFDDAKTLAEAGADIIAIDGTSRSRPKENLQELIQKIKKELNKPVMADVSTQEEGLNCSELGADIISTTLSGYTSYTQGKNNGKPDFKLLERLVKSQDKPVVLEGRIWTPEHVKTAFDLGAFSVVIGSAITRPQLITRRFVESIGS